MIKRFYSDEPRSRCEGAGKYIAIGALIGIPLILSNIKCNTRNYAIIEIRNQPYVIQEKSNNLENLKELYTLDDK